MIILEDESTEHVALRAHYVEGTNMPRRKETEMERRARALHYLAQDIFAIEYQIETRDLDAAWRELNEREQAHYHDIAVTVLAQMEHDYRKRRMTAVKPEEGD